MNCAILYVSGVELVVSSTTWLSLYAAPPGAVSTNLSLVACCSCSTTECPITLSPVYRKYPYSWSPPKPTESDSLYCSILDDQLIVIGPRDDAATTFARAWTAMWRPFSSRTWMFLFFITLSYTLVRGWIAFHFSDPWSWNRFHDNFLGEYDPEQVYSGPARDGLPRVRNQAELRRLNTYLSYSFKMGFVIVFLFYEISLVDFVFSQSREQMDELDPSQFVITGNTTQERKFKEYIESQEFGNCLGGNNEPCWKQVGSIAQVYTNITSQGGKKPDRYRYSAVYETLNRYWFKKNSSLCKELQVLDYAELNRPFMGVWYYSSNISQARRTEMDMAIAELREDDKIRGFLHNVSGSKLPANCENSSSIDYLQLGMPLVTCSGPIFCAVLVYMCLSTIPWRNRSVNKKTKDSVNNDEGEKDPESQTDVRAISKCKLNSLDWSLNAGFFFIMWCILRWGSCNYVKLTELRTAMKFRQGQRNIYYLFCTVMTPLIWIKIS